MGRAVAKLVKAAKANILPKSSVPRVKGRLALKSGELSASHIRDGVAGRKLMGAVQLSHSLELSRVEAEVVSKPDDVSELANDLRPVLDSPGIHLVKCLEKGGELCNKKLLSSEFIPIVQPEDIDTTSIPPFVTSSRDPAMIASAKAKNCTFMGSTSSTTGFLSHLLFLLMGLLPSYTFCFVLDEITKYCPKLQILDVNVRLIERVFTLFQVTNRMTPPTSPKSSNTIQQPSLGQPDFQLP